MKITLSAAQCRTLYEDHFKVDMPGNMEYGEAARLVEEETSDVEFIARLAHLNRDGTYRL
jgi:hypothetical protein